ncbi:Uncharacterised protein [Elizabethkingia miricola]|nr:Uncharacterised protein [Elizabethkingia miricola]
MKRVLLSASVVLLPFLPYAQEVGKKDTLKQKEKNIDGVVITALGIGKKAKKLVIPLRKSIPNSSKL